MYIHISHWFLLFFIGVFYLHKSDGFGEIESDNTKGHAAHLLTQTCTSIGASHAICQHAQKHIYKDRPIFTMAYPSWNIWLVCSVLKPFLVRDISPFPAFQSSGAKDGVSHESEMKAELQLNHQIEEI